MSESIKRQMHAETSKYIIFINKKKCVIKITRSLGVYAWLGFFLYIRSCPGISNVFLYKKLCYWNIYCVTSTSHGKNNFCSVYIGPHGKFQSFTFLFFIHSSFLIFLNILTNIGAYVYRIELTIYMKFMKC